MLHELLFALSGYPGSLFVEKSDKIEVTDCASFLHPSETILLNRILRIATEYKHLQDFIDIHITDISVIDSHDGVNESNQALRGMYLRAFCEGLNKVLEPYRKEIVNLERDILNDPYLTLTYILSVVEKYCTLFEVLNAIVREIELHHIQGCLILGLLHQHCSSGVVEVQNAVKRILSSCHIVLLKQLSSWILYGELIDRYGEFFIRLADPLSPADSDVSRETNSDLAELGMQKSSFTIESYAMYHNMLPSYIPYSLASKVLFIGQTVIMFRNDPQNKISATGSIGKHLRSVWGEKEEEFFLKFQELYHMETLVLSDLEKIIDEIRACVAEHLWTLAVKNAELFVQLKLIKDFFMMGRGELFLEFIRQANPVLQVSPTSTTNRDVNQAFQIAALKVLMDDESTLEKFYFVVTDETWNFKQDQPKESGWPFLTLKYKVGWPLQLLFNTQALHHYNYLFCFLLCVKRTQNELHNIWSRHIRQKSKCVSKYNPMLWQLRNNLMFIIDNLQYYLQVDVLESQYMQLQTIANTTKDFENIQKAHNMFLTNVLSQTFLLTACTSSEEQCFQYKMPPSFKSVHEGSAEKINPVHKHLIDLLQLSELFCKFAADLGINLSTEQQKCLDKMTEQFEYEVFGLLKLLSGLKSRPCGTHLSQLLLRLDYNRWFSKQINISVTGSTYSV